MAFFNEILGPKSDERGEEKPNPHDVRLCDKRPLYYALLENPDAPSLGPDQVQEAKSELAELIARSPEEILGCQRKTLDEARTTLHALQEKQAA